MSDNEYDNIDIIKNTDTDTDTDINGDGDKVVDGDIETCFNDKNQNQNNNQYDLLDNIDNIINNNNFGNMISTLSDKLKLNNSENETNNSNSDYSYSDTETNNDIILDNYLLNSSGENIADILTKINNNLTRLINYHIKH